ncbi:MAG: S26 family signal peptidase, partial [Dysgonamonadaceae bacterium]|nr:S26 family signal peptidase [Dysgonamonadaceae bacterium]
ALPGDTFSIENGIYIVKGITDKLGHYEREVELSQKADSLFPPEIFNCFPHDTANFGWTIKNFGPLYVPKAKDTVHLDTLNYVLYKNLIEYETDRPVRLRDGKLYLGDRVLYDYTFQMNYYFMAGDYIFDSRDSRYWGLLPEDHIVGKAAVIWQSKDMLTKKRRWNRIFKAVK